MQPESSKHSPRLDDGMEAEDQTILRSGQPPRTEEWREPEPFDPGHLETELPEGTPQRNAANVSPIA